MRVSVSVSVSVGVSVRGRVGVRVSVRVSVGVRVRVRVSVGVRVRLGALAERLTQRRQQARQHDALQLRPQPRAAQPLEHARLRRAGRGVRA